MATPQMVQCFGKKKTGMRRPPYMSWISYWDVTSYRSRTLQGKISRLIERRKTDLTLTIERKRSYQSQWQAAATRPAWDPEVQGSHTQFSHDNKCRDTYNLCNRSMSLFWSSDSTNSLVLISVFALLVVVILRKYTLSDRLLLNPWSHTTKNISTSTPRTNSSRLLFNTTEHYLLQTTEDVNPRSSVVQVQEPDTKSHIVRLETKCVGCILFAVEVMAAMRLRWS